MRENAVRVMIVEDDNLVALELKGRLEAMGYQVAAAATSAPEAVDTAATVKPDVVLLDIRLGEGLDGIDAAVAIKGRFGVPVVFVTAHSDRETLARAGLVEPAWYVLKPIRDYDLQAAIDAAVAPPVNRHPPPAKC